MQLMQDAATGDGNGEVVSWNGGPGTFFVSGTLASATVTLQALLPKATAYVDVGDDATLTAAGMANFHLPRCSLRAVISGAGSPAAITAGVQPWNP